MCSKTRSQRVNHGISSAACDQNASGSRSPSSIRVLYLCRQFHACLRAQDDSGYTQRPGGFLRFPGRERGRPRARPRRDGGPRQLERRRRRHSRGLFQRQLQGCPRGNGRRKIMRRMPLIAGIDVAGTVESSTDARFAPGNRVLVTGYDLGVAHDGGFSERCRVPGDWVVPVPDGLSLHDAMATAPPASRPRWPCCGSSAMASHQDRVPSPSPEPPAASAASPPPSWRGWATRSWPSPARTISTTTCADWARARCARGTRIDLGTRPLEKATWAGAVDAVGGDSAGLAAAYGTGERRRREHGAHGRHRSPS